MGRQKNSARRGGGISSVRGDDRWGTEGMVLGVDDLNSHGGDGWSSGGA